MSGSTTAKARAKPRRSYHHGDLVAALVAEAGRFVEEHGHEALSVRDVARHLGVSAAAPFRHFRDRDDLLRAVAWAAMHTYAEQADEAAKRAGEDPLSQFRALGLTEIRFAVGHPNLMRLMRLPAMQQPPSTATPEQIAAVKLAHGRARTLVRDAQGRGTMRSGDPAVLELAGVALARGLSQMFLDGLLPRQGGEALAEAVLDVLGSGYRPAAPR